MYKLTSVGFVAFLSFYLFIFFKGPLSRSVSAGSSGLTVVSKEQSSVDMNGPVVPEKLLKNIQVMYIAAATFGFYCLSR